MFTRGILPPEVCLKELVELEGSCVPFFVGIGVSQSIEEGFPWFLLRPPYVGFLRSVSRNFMIVKGSSAQEEAAI